jgi:hypothetical protein
MFAFSALLADKTEVRACNDVVFHYWLPYLRRQFRERLTSRLLGGRFDDLCRRWPELWALRPQPNRLQRLKVRIKPFLQAAGFIRDRLRAQG